MVKKLYHFILLLIDSWSKDKISTYSASLAYYTIFALTPIIIICTAIIGLAFGHEIAEEHIFNLISLLIGVDSARQVETMIHYANKPFTGISVEIISIIVLIIGASGIFIQIQLGLNEIWGVSATRQTGFFSLIKERFLSFLMVLGVSFLLLVSIFASVLLTILSKNINSLFYSESVLIGFFHFIVSIIVISFLFAMLYKILPDVKLAWNDVLMGSVIAASLFTLGKYLLSLYLGALHVENAYGPAGALIIILIWIYYSAQILFIGAEITKIQKKNNKKIVPESGERSKINKNGS